MKHATSPQTQKTRMIESVVSECYPVIQDTITAHAEKLRQEYQRNTGMKMQLSSAREIILKLFAATGGDILL